MHDQRTQSLFLFLSLLSLSLLIGCVLNLNKVIKKVDLEGLNDLNTDQEGRVDLLSNRDFFLNKKPDLIEEILQSFQKENKFRFLGDFEDFGEWDCQKIEEGNLKKLNLMCGDLEIVGWENKNKKLVFELEDLMFRINGEDNSELIFKGIKIMQIKHQKTWVSFRVQQEEQEREDIFFKKSFDPLKTLFDFNLSKKQLFYNDQILAQIFQGFVNPLIILVVWFLINSELREIINFIYELPSKNNWSQQYDESLKHRQKQKLQEKQTTNSQKVFIKKLVNQNQIQKESQKKNQNKIESEKSQKTQNTETDDLLKEIEFSLKDNNLKPKNSQISLKQDQISIISQEINSPISLLETEKFNEHDQGKIINKSLFSQNTNPNNQLTLDQIIEDAYQDGELTAEERILIHQKEMEHQPQRCNRRSDKGQYSLLCDQCYKIYQTTCLLCQRKKLSDINKIAALTCYIHQDQTHTELPDYCSICRIEIIKDVNQGGMGYICLRPCSNTTQCCSMA